MAQLPNEEYVHKDGVIYCTMLQQVKHTIGMDNRSCYTRHGKKFYRPYRNHFTTPKREKAWDELVVDGLAKCHEDENGAEYWLTRKGLDWLGEHIGVTIHDCER